MESIYILLTKSDTYFSRFIHYVTEDEFTHSSISLDRNLNQVYSFGRRNPRLIWPAGLVREDVRSGLFKQSENNNCCLFELVVEDDVYASVLSDIETMMKDSRKYHYNLLGTFYCKMNIPHTNGNKYFCSEFVSDLLDRNAALPLIKPASLMRPVDFFDVKELNVLYSGELKYCFR